MANDRIETKSFINATKSDNIEAFKGG